MVPTRSLAAAPRNSRLREAVHVPTKAAKNSPKRAISSFYIASGLFAYALSTYGFYLYTSLAVDFSFSDLPQDTDTSFRYNTTAPTYDSTVSTTETWTGITKLRRRLASQATGHVLETSVGTGRNAEYYDLKKVTSVTCIDQSGPMVEIAKTKWKELHPGFKRSFFYTQSAMDTVPLAPRKGFTTVIQTMGVCSTPSPAATLAHLGTLLDPEEGRILLLEHGRGYYDWINWILDKSAARHAEKHGCWFNRDVGKVLEESELVLGKVERKQFGTLWYVEARPKGWKGRGIEEKKR